MIKLKALWNLLCAQHYFLVTPQALISCYPKDETKLNMIRDFAEAAEKLVEQRERKQK